MTASHSSDAGENKSLTLNSADTDNPLSMTPIANLATLDDDSGVYLMPVT